MAGGKCGQLGITLFAAPHRYQFAYLRALNRTLYIVVAIIARPGPACSCSKAFTCPCWTSTIKAFAIAVLGNPASIRTSRNESGPCRKRSRHTSCTSVALTAAWVLRPRLTKAAVCIPLVSRPKILQLYYMHTLLQQRVISRLQRSWPLRLPLACSRCSPPRMAEAAR